MVRTATICLAILGAMVLALGGCGGGGSSTMTKAEYKQQLRLVCNEGLQEREDLVKAITKDYYEKREETATPQYQAENLRKVIGVYQKTTEQIAEIGLPEGNEKQAEKLVQAREEAAARVEASPLGTRDALNVVFKNANETAADLEAPSCFL